MTHLAERILTVPPALALLLVFALPALEASAFVGFIIPGEIGVILGGVLANQHKLPLWGPAPSSSSAISPEPSTNGSRTTRVCSASPYWCSS